jgi:hypothetical protein
VREWRGVEWSGVEGGGEFAIVFVVVPFIMIHAFVVVVVDTFAMNVLKTVKKGF